MDQFVKRRIAIVIEAVSPGDDDFAPIVAMTLHELADMIDSGTAGRHEREVYQRDGVLAVISAEDVTGVCIPYQCSGAQSIQVGYVPRSA